jgi:hypothetical protein
LSRRDSLRAISCRAVSARCVLPTPSGPRTCMVVDALGPTDRRQRINGVFCMCVWWWRCVSIASSHASGVIMLLIIRMRMMEQDDDDEGDTDRTRGPDSHSSHTAQRSLQE